MLVETLLGLSDTRRAEINASQKCDCSSEASVTEIFPPVEKLIGVSFRDDHCNHTDDKEHAAFHQELHPDTTIQGYLFASDI